MKTISLLSFVAFFTINSSLFAFESNFSAGFEDETYVNDIPFSTENIYKSYLETAAFFSSSKAIADEAYLNDIPFDTQEIADAYMVSNLMLAGKMNDEAYVDDIPMNTELVAIENENLNDSNVAVVNNEAYITVTEEINSIIIPSGSIEVNGRNFTFGESTMGFKAENMEKELALLIEKVAGAIKDQIDNGQEVITLILQNGNKLDTNAASYTISIKNEVPANKVSSHMGMQEKVVKE
jgi:hypothetical protein